jgi:hypothetical protein
MAESSSGVVEDYDRLNGTERRGREREEEK